ncbi:hypothetical protein llap_19425 [Limosa lapponica baueri]|uniref:CDC20/Fizzy WD40 domain-containing protein n=1 Tax=Limosa lapponica baueri TaxID=1758121 RepID=A0A2I0T8Y0_LIMLA|nr:hypothetical protein llap_19425 [Limosa lapponica baueri]
MDQDYERRLLRQINIQNENTMPCVAEMRRTLTPSNSPMSSPSKHGDRFIPSRAGANWSINFHRINGNLVAVGTHKGFVQIWDAAAGKKLSMLEGHTARVGALAWNADQLSSGSRDRMILQRDIRTPPLQSERRLQGHRQEVCGLKWSTDHQLLASGGNDNKLLVWNHSSLSPVQQYTEHLAAVKAIAWSPHQHGLLASGGGTADRCIRFWNTLTGQPLQCIDTGSQVCNLAWSKHANELVSTHGYSQNQILVWKYPSLTQVAKLTGHSYRVLYLAMSPDGEAIVTGAGDETLRFWNVFSKTRSTKVGVRCAGAVAVSCGRLGLGGVCIRSQPLHQDTINPIYCGPGAHGLMDQDKTSTWVCMEPRTISQKGRESRDWRMDPADAN